MEHLTVEDLLSIAEEVLGVPAVRDIGLLDSAAHRPQASAFGKDAYSTIDEKAAALLEAVARSHALVDGNKRLAWAAAPNTGGPMSRCVIERSKRIADRARRQVATNHGKRAALHGIATGLGGCPQRALHPGQEVEQRAAEDDGR
jgi:hypothetical protein